MTTRRNQDAWRKSKGRGKSPAKVARATAPATAPARATSKASAKKPNKNLEVHLKNLSDQEDSYIRSGESGSDSDHDSSKKQRATKIHNSNKRKGGKDNSDKRTTRNSGYEDYDEEMIGASNEIDNRDFADDDYNETQCDTFPNKKHRAEISERQENTDSSRKEQQRTEYMKQLKQEGVLQSGDSMRKVIRDYVKTTLFRKLKFITCPSQMMHDSDVAQKVMKDYGVVEGERYSWWSERKAYIFNAIRTRRNNTGSCIRNAFLRKYRERVQVSYLEQNSPYLLLSYRLCQNRTTDHRTYHECKKEPQGLPVVL